MSSHESAESTAIAANASGLREARFHEPNPPDEKPNRPRLEAFAIVRYAPSTCGITSCRTYDSKLPVTGESTHWPHPYRHQPSGMTTIIGAVPIRPNTASSTSSSGGSQRCRSVAGVISNAALLPSACSR